MSSQTQPARGMRDFLPSDKKLRDTAVSIIRDTYRRYGYQEIETPAIEEFSRLTSGQGGDNEKMIFSILRRGLDPDLPVRPRDAVDLGLRYDLTLPLARYYATNAAVLETPARIIQIAPVWRSERPQKGRFRQFTQCDIDVIGEPSLIAEAELITVTNRALAALGIRDSVVRINDREILHGMLRGCGFPAELNDRSLIVIDKLDKIGSEAVVRELENGLGVAPASARQLGDLLAAFEALPARSAFDAVAALLPVEVDRAAIQRMFDIRDLSIAADPTIALTFDISLVRGMGYYTGPIFEIAHPSTSSSIAGGGRYDKMIGRFAGRDVPACGFSIGFERILGLIKLPAAVEQRVALVYSDGVDRALVLREQARLVDEGYLVQLLAWPKRLAPALERLRVGGVSGFALLEHDTGAPVEVRSIQES